MKGKRGEVERVLCTKKRKEYKGLLEKKREEHNETWLKEMEEDKSIKKFWKEINIGKKRVRVLKKIKQGK